MTTVVAKRFVLCTLSGNAQVHVHYMTVPSVGDVGGNVVVCTCRVHETAEVELTIRSSLTKIPQYNADSVINLLYSTTMLSQTTMSIYATYSVHVTHICLNDQT